MNRLLRYFKYAHLPAGPMYDVSAKCASLASRIDADLTECAEKTVGLRKLLEAKDCFVRAALDEVNGK